MIVLLVSNYAGSQKFKFFEIVLVTHCLVPQFSFLLYLESDFCRILKTTIGFSANSYPLCCLAFLLSHYIVQFSRCSLRIQIHLTMEVYPLN